MTVATRKLSHFALEEEVGSGGAGLVYRALDLNLGRRVALKLLRCGDAASRRRFLAEARAASSLDHPNICTIFEAGESDEGEMFIAMAWYDGETLDRILTRGPLPPRKAAALAIQVARGLAAAHEELLIHRDIKPANLMLAQGETVKILDFGLARLLSAPGSRTVDGTPAYMSPEQFRGDHVDQRTDLWSLGVVLHEMVAGAPPFRGKSMAEITRAILSDSPPPLPVFADIFARALAKDPRFRYDRAEGLITDLQGAIAEMDSGTVTLRRIPVTAKASLAVLPFVDMSPEQDQQYLCDGIAEEILRALSRIPDLHVASRTSAFQFRHGDVREIGARLGVEAVLEGSVRRAGDRVRVSAQLVDVADGYRRWYERFDREMKDIFAIEDEIAEQIAGALEVTLLHREVPPVANAEAYELYLQGMQFFHQHRRKGFEIAIQTFGRALELDPGDARSNAGIANCHSFLCLYFGRTESARDADSASLRAVALAPDLPEARAARGLALFVA
ncbi:MAG: protein kinase domain-containing protein, partial [Thermoanaerobaculia bacterium]